MPIPTLDNYRSTIYGQNSKRKQGGYLTRRESHTLVAASQEPLVSIITVVRNGKSTIDATIKSVLSQTYSNIEFIIVDGASTDGTLEILQQYNDRIAFWISEPDAGLYDAMNKGIAASHGDFIGILNADDTYSSDVVVIAQAHLRSQEPMLSYGKTQVVDAQGTLLRTVGRKFNPKFLFGSFGFLHPSVIATRKVYEMVGLFDTSYRCAADSDWLVRCYKKNVPFCQLPYICRMADGGVSNSQLKYVGYGEYLQSLANHGFSKQTIYLSMLWIGARSLLNLVLKRDGL